MKMGNTFVTIGSPKFLAAFFRPKENLHVKFNGALKICVQCFSGELFSCDKNILAETFIFNIFH